MRILIVPEPEFSTECMAQNITPDYDSRSVAPFKRV
jgi:hypothetical protein